MIGSWSVRGCTSLSIMHTYIYIYIHIYVNIAANTYTHTYIYMYRHHPWNTHVVAYIYIYIFMYKVNYMCMYVCIYIYILGIKRICAKHHWNGCFYVKLLSHFKTTMLGWYFFWITTSHSINVKSWWSHSIP